MSQDDSDKKPAKKPARSKAGLKAQPAAREVPRAASGVTLQLKTLKPPRQFEVFQVQDHRGMAVAFRKVAERVAEDPEFAIMLAINPVLAMDQYGIKLSPEMQDHVLRAVRHSPRLATRRQELEAKLTEALGGPPRVDDPVWLADVMFSRLELKPLDIGKAEPAYRPPLNADVLERLKPIRPEGKPRYSQPRRIKKTSSIGMKPWKEAVRRLDLGAKPPSLPPAKERPERLTLESAWFYKDQNELARDLVELGQIQRMAFPVRTPDAFRKIAAGEQPNAFRSWITSIRFKDPGGRKRS